MYTLFIDTHLWDIIIVLFKNGKVVNKNEVINKKNNSEYIFPTIIKTIDDIKLDEIIVVNGPGSFTGSRLGVTIAKTFAYSLNIPIKTISSLECVAVSSGSFNVLIDDHNGYYVGNFNSDYSLKKDYYYVNKSELKDKNNYSYDVTYDYEKIYKYVSEKKEAINPHMVKPIYVKKIGIEK